MKKRSVLRLKQRIRKQGKDFLEIADDLGDIHQKYAEMLLKRKKGAYGTFTTSNDINEMRAWIIGQRLFQSFLNQWRIPHLHDEPAFKFECERLVGVDFIIPGFGSVDVKTRPWGTDILIIRRDDWDYHVRQGIVPDYVVALMLKPEGNAAQIVGYEHGAEVNKLPNAPGICIYKQCYSKLYSELHDFRELDALLKRCSLNPELCNVVES